MRPAVLLALTLAIPTLLPTPSYADVNLVMACTDSNALTKGTGAGLAACTNTTWVRPTATTAVLSCETAKGCAWGTADARYRTFSTLAATAMVKTCQRNVPVGPFTATDPCGNGENAEKPWTQKAAVQTGNLIEANGTATLSWTAPTQNTDGSNLTNLAGYNVYQGTSEAAVTQINTTLIPAGITSYSVQDLPAGTWWYAVDAQTSEGATSTLSNKGSKLVVATPAPTVSFSGNPPSGQSRLTTTLTWGTTNATSCKGSGGGSQWDAVDLTANGSRQITGITTSTTFSITCTGPGGQATGTFTVTVQAAPLVPNPPTNFTVH